MSVQRNSRRRSTSISADASRSIHRRPSRHRSSTRPRSHSHHSRHSSRRRKPRSNHRHRQRSHSHHHQTRRSSTGSMHRKRNNNDNTAFIESSLHLHNKLRRRHGARALQLNNDLCNLAQKWANYLAEKTQFKHSGTEYRGSKLGENLYYQSNPMEGGKESTKAWYNEIKDYDFNRGEFSQATGHFTQLVWKESKEVGFGLAKGASMYYTVAMYFPAGNIDDQFMQNVLPVAR
ncbi:hypothetical protein I4U23_003800 [Adineta vaga]|nr:hypothetical protein I4U23_003800 [Adineta vaga]